MSDVVFVRGDGTAPAEPPKQPRRRKPWWEVMDPGERASWRDLPRLLADSLRLVWEAGRTEFLITTALQVITGFGIAARARIRPTDAIALPTSPRKPFTIWNERNWPCARARVSWS